MNYTFTGHGFQGTDMAVISGAWKSILTTQQTICDVEVTVPGVTRNILYIHNKTNSSFDHNHTYMTL